MVAALVFAVWYVVYTYRLITLDDLTGLFDRVAQKLAVSKLEWATL